MAQFIHCHEETKWQVEDMFRSNRLECLHSTTSVQCHTLDKIIALLKDAVHFTVFDSTKGFFHVPLDEASKMLTTMLTPVGIYIYNVLVMGLSNATDIFESCIQQILEGLNGTINIADDVLVFGCGYSLFKSNVIGFLDQCVEKDLHLNPDKI